MGRVGENACKVLTRPTISLGVSIGPGFKSSRKEVCKDKDKYCLYWKNKGYCSVSSKFSSYMNVHCPRSCGACSAENNCKDDKPSCSYWHQKGFCKESSQYFRYVFAHCKRACGA